MADKRINALANTASSTASDDFFAVDGTTNGTRKLNAYSPTFGGNATVTGTLTVNGGSADLGTGHGVKLYVNNAGAWANKELLVTGYDVLDYTQIKVPGNASNTASIKLNQNGLATFSGNILVSGTTASTSTSTGALVVSGGVGVAGAINVGGNATVSGTLQLANNTALQFLDSAGTSRRTLLTTTLDYNYFGAIDAGWGGTTDIRAGTNMFLRTNGASGTFVDALTITNNGIVSVPTTFASTSTSTGALVVSGGVGVAGAINAGGIIEVNFSSAVAFRGTSTNSDCQLRLVNNSSGGREYHLSSSGTAAGGGAGFHVWDGTANVSALSIDASRNSTFGGSVKTSAPSGGTAAAWKLGTVASVSPTSPNRTIEVDIGGTIYYIHAKTTNN